MDCRNVVTYKYTPQPQNKTNSCLLMKFMSTTIEASFLITNQIKSATKFIQNKR